MTLDNIADMTTTSQDKSSSVVYSRRAYRICTTITMMRWQHKLIYLPSSYSSIDILSQTLIEDDGAQQRPIRASVVVSKVRLIPAPGFLMHYAPIWRHKIIWMSQPFTNIYWRFEPDYLSATLFNQE